MDAGSDRTSRSSKGSVYECHQERAPVMTRSSIYGHNGEGRVGKDTPTSFRLGRTTPVSWGPSNWTRRSRSGPGPLQVLHSSNLRAFGTRSGRSLCARVPKDTRKKQKIKKCFGTQGRLVLSRPEGVRNSGLPPPVVLTRRRLGSS